MLTSRFFNFFFRYISTFEAGGCFMLYILLQFFYLFFVLIELWEKMKGRGEREKRKKNFFLNKAI